MLKDYVISNGLKLSKERYFKLLDAIKKIDNGCNNGIVDRNFIYLNTGEKFQIEYKDNFTLVAKIIL